MKTHTSRSDVETFAAGEAFASGVSPGSVIALVGELGSGKTRFVSGACRALGVTAPVTSPTFTIINEYPAPFGRVIHIDLYRIARKAELADLGLEEYFVPQNICFIEWAEQVMDLLPGESKVVRFTHGRQANERIIEIGGGV